MINALEVVELAGILQRAIGEDVLFSEMFEPPSAQSYREYQRMLHKLVNDEWSLPKNAATYGGAAAPGQRTFNLSVYHGLKQAMELAIKRAKIPSLQGWPQALKDELRRPIETLINQEAIAAYRFAQDVDKIAKRNGGTRADLGKALRRADMWAQRWKEVYEKTMAAALTMQKNLVFLRWDFGKTKEHCRDCARYVGRVYSAKVWTARGALPQSRALACRGYRCDCRLVKTTEKPTPGYPPRPMYGDEGTI